MEHDDNARAEGRTYRQFCADGVEMMSCLIDFFLASSTWLKALLS